MNKQLQTIFDNLERERQALLNELKSLPADRLHAHPPGKWSIAQVLAHLIAAERLSLQYLKKKILAVHEVGDTGIMAELKLMTLQVSQRLPGLKFKAPRVVVDNTPTYESLAHIEADWAQVRAELKEFLEPIPEQHLKRMIYKHVVAGRLNVRHALLFFREHIIHHRSQIKKLAKSS